ncbi:MAG TPA: amidohydrolase family protein [Acidimicrobiales bacterium]
MTTDGQRRQVLVSTDGHAGADLLDYRPYLERAFHERFDAWAAQYHDAWADDLDQDRDPNHRVGVASAGASVNWDAKERLELLDEQGIAAEVLFPNTSPPFYPSGAVTAPGPRTAEELELRLAGVRAHNRWLADFCSEAPDRWAGFAQLFLDDVDAAVAEVRWAKEAGLRGVLVPNDHVLRMANLYYPAYDPLWAVCAELGMPVHRHATFPTEPIEEGGPASALIGMTEMQFYVMRSIGHMILSGTFERHPDLTYVVTEITSAAQIKGYLAQLDGMLQVMNVGEHLPMYEQIQGAVAALKKLPSEYFAENCFVAGPTHDLRIAYDLGLPNLMWGADVPHSEGTHPYSTEAIRLMLSDLPADELDVLLARRATELYSFDPVELQAVADRIGPTVDQLTTPLGADEWPAYPADTRCTIFATRPAA